MHCIKKLRTSIGSDVQYFEEDVTVERLRSKLDEMFPLHAAAKGNNVNLLQHLLGSGWDVNAKDSMGMTPLMLAVNACHFDTVKLLLEKKADVFVTYSANLNILEFLLSKLSTLPVSIVARALDILMKCGLDAVAKAKILVKSNCHLKLVLHLKDARVTREFLELKDLLTGEESHIALDFALSRSDWKNVRVLLHHGPDADFRRDLFFCHKLIDLLHTKGRRNLETAKFFLVRLDAWGLIIEETIEHFSLMFSVGEKDTVELLLDCQIDVLFKNKLGHNLVAHIFENRSFDAVDLLQNRQFNVNARGGNGWSALHFAVKGNSENNVGYLLDLGADIEIKNDRGRTPLLEAVAWGRPDMVRLLLQHGADIRAVVHDKFTLFDPFDQTFCPFIQEFVLAQLTFNEALGVTIEGSIRARIYSNPQCKKFYEYCGRQIAKMKLVKMSNSFTLFTAVAGDIGGIARHVPDFGTAIFLQNNCKDYKIHPYFLSTLQHKLRKASKLKPKERNLPLVVSQSSGTFTDFQQLTTADVDMLLAY